jgi:WD40 repeat protein
MADVFISYAREDAGMVRALVDVLETRDREVWVDWRSIPPTAEWLHEIDRAIESTDAFLFVISPDSVASETCGHEVRHALRNNKKIIPVLCRDVDAERVQPELARINWILMREEEGAGAAAEKVLVALDLDLDWTRRHTRLLTRALEWDGGGRADSATLRGRDLELAEAWLAESSDHEPKPTVVMSEFIVAGRTATTRRQRRLLAGVSLALVVTLVLAVVAWIQRNEATLQARLSLSRQLAAEARVQFADQLDLGLLLAAESYRVADTLEARSTLLAGLAANPRLTGHLHGHGDLLGAMAFSPDGRQFASANRDGVLILWSWDGALEKTRTIPLPAGSPTFVNFTPGGEVLLGGDGPDVLRVEGERVVPDTGFRFPADAQVRGVSPDGRRAVALEQGQALGRRFRLTVHLADRREPGTMKTLDGGLWGGVNDAVFSPDGTVLAVGGCADFSNIGICRGHVTLWDAMDGKPLSPPLAEYEYPVGALTFSPDGRLLATGSQGQGVVLWDLETQERVAPVLPGYARPALALAFSPGGGQLAIARLDRSISVWDLESSEPVGEPMAGPAVGAYSLAFSPDGSLLLAGYLEGQLLAWSAGAGLPMATVLGQHDDQVYRVRFSRDGKLLASAGEDLRVRLWDRASGQEKAVLQGEHEDIVSALAFRPGTRQILSADTMGQVRLLPTDAGVQLQAADVELSRALYDADFSPNGDAAALAGERGEGDEPRPALTLWRPGYGEPLQPVESPANYLQSVRYAPAGGLLATGGGDGSIQIFELEGGLPVRPHTLREAREGLREGVNALAFDQAGRRLAAGLEDKTVQLWDLTAESHTVLAAHTAEVGGVALGPEGRWLASGGFDHAVMLWDTLSARRVGPALVSHTDRIFTVDMTPDGKWLATGGADGRVIRWDLRPERWLELACEVAGRQLDSTEWQRYRGDAQYGPTCGDVGTEGGRGQ